MKGSLTKADHFRRQADKYQVLAKFARPAYFGDFYWRIAARYNCMAEEAARRDGKFPVAFEEPVRERLPR
jgi:hypothetical protein